MHLLAPFSKPKSHEDLFLEHYDWLVQWALQLNHGRREEATDLVHDLYVQLVRTRPDVDRADPDRIRGYLYTMLRNLSVSKARRHGRDALSSLLIVDYESVEFGLACIDRSKLILVRSDLARICEYACIRRDSSRSASVLILRFFLGYYPSEIASILQVTRAAVEKHLQAARQEARVYLERPGVLRFLGQDIPLASLSSSFLPDDPIALFAELRRRIFAGAKEACLAESSIEARYSQESSGMNTPEFAHVVSCVRCLEMTNRALGLKPLANRFPSDTINRDGDGNEPPGPTGKGSDSDVFEEKVRQSYEHVPIKLQVAVDGEVRAAQRVSSNRSELQVKLEPLAKPAFLEVLSEQGIRLAYLQIEDSVSEPQCYGTTAELSDDRFVELKLSFVSGELVVSAYYYDPLQEEIRAEIKSQFLAARSADIPSSPSSSPLSLRVAARRIGRLIHSWFPSFDSLWPLGLAMATTGLLLLGLGLRSNKSLPATPPTATALIEKAQQIEEVKMAGGAAIHSTFSFETRSLDGKLLETQKIDSWRTLKPHRLALRLTDGDGRIVGGRWRDASGKTTTFSQERGLRSGEIPPIRLVDRNSAWEMFPGEEAYAALSSIGGEPKLQTADDGYEIEYERRQIRPNVSILRASLVLDRATLRPVSETVDIETGDSVREYRFQRLTYEVVSGNEVRDSDFVPDAALASLHSGTSVPPKVGGSTAHLTLEALQLLNNLGPDIERIVNLERRADGGVELNGVFFSSEQKASVVRVFRSLRGDGQLKLALHSSDEAVEPSKVPRPISTESFEPVAVDSQHVPFDPNLRSVLTAQGLTGLQLDDRIRQIASDITTHGAQLHREGWSICQIATRDFSIDELRTMTAEDQMLWVTLLDKHMRSFDQQIAALHTELTPLIREARARLPDSSKIPSSLHDAGELGQTATTLNDDSEHLDRLLTAGFTLSPSSLPANTNFLDIAQLISDLDSEETTLRGTIERLQTFGQADTHK